MSEFMIVGREDYQQRVREAERAYRYANVKGTSRFSSVLASLLSLLPRF